MRHDPSPTQLPAPCIIDTGIVVNKLDMHRLLADLHHVRYLHIQDERLQSQGEGYVLEVFADPNRATLVANRAIYLNLYSFDYLELKQSPECECYFDLVQDSRRLRLIPSSNSLQERCTAKFNAAALDAVVDQVLSGKWDLQIDEDDEPF
ncbi:hypothetical protein [Microseira wollei]|uniref:DUF5615 domain-containing protein n=1 Tax=Microseira wollei NIES-4236 TaxID=2530354 RepID=A0AAV3XRQ7_9CYAN|nr:hypothetical protein [Microseira wollei]GET43589.1 hypothetical protein MiSe_84140 [Microseira wollei NIES-4236]